MSRSKQNTSQDDDNGETLSSSETDETPANTACAMETGRKNSLHGPQEKPCTDTTIIIHETGYEEPEREKYLRNSGIVYRAMHLLEEWKFVTARISCARVPVDIIAFRKDMSLLVQVISSRGPLPNAKAIVRHYAVKIHDLRTMGTSLNFRKMLMAYSRPCGWKYYDVLPGGLIPAWSVPVPPAT